ncbi:MAG: AMP-binding protein, partial [Myxococcota bacterium]
MEDLNQVIPRLSRAQGMLETYAGRSKDSRPFSAVYSDVLDAIAFLDDLGLNRGDRVGILAKNCYEWILLDLACLARAFVVVPFDPNIEMTTEELFEHYQLAVLLTNLPDRRGDDPRIHDLAAIRGGSWSGGELTPARYQATDIVAFKFTSGTTKRPKSLLTQKHNLDDCITNIQDR